MTNRLRENLFIFLYLIVDIALIYISFTLAYWVRFYIPIIPVTRGIPSFANYQMVIPIIILIWILIFRQFGLYDLKRPLSSFDEFFRTAKVVCFGIAFIMAATFLYREFSYSRVVLGYAWLFSILSIYCGRELIKGISGSLLKDRGRGTLIMGEGDTPQKIKEILDERGVKTYTNPVLKGASLLDFIKDNRIDEVIVTEPIDHKDLWRIVNQCEEVNTGFKLVPDIVELRFGELVVDDRLGLPTLRLKTTPLIGINLFIKRIIDIIFSIIAIFLFSPVLLLIGILIRFDSPGPILYSQPRLGYKKKPFSFLKFRTMVKDADKMLEGIKHLSDRQGPAFKMKDDPRITRVGRWLRRMSLDELPQLINVLRGEMSLVGPRPQVLWEAAHYDEWAERRLRIPPGITGLWQVSGRSEISYEEMIKLDLYYLENWSLELDLKILLKTIPAILKGRGAY